MNDNTPAYNLKAVIRETGLTAATLRAWERRYGLLKPKRSPGGHRLYTKEEIDMLKWLVARQSEGLSISHAIDLWRARKATATPPTAQLPIVEIKTDIGTLDILRKNWLSACRDFDEKSAELALSQALAIAPPDVVCIEFLQKALFELGEGWYSGAISVQQEHFASSLAARRLNALLAVAPIPTRKERFLFACPPGETHDLALLMLAVILRWQGWNVVYLGADVPLVRLDATLQSTASNLVISVAQTLPNAASLKELGEFLKSLGVPLAFGGGIFNRIPELAERIPGYFLGQELRTAPQVVEDLINRKPELPSPPLLSPNYIQTLEAYSEKEALIVFTVSRLLENSQIVPLYVEEANRNFSNALTSVLKLGHIDFLDEMVEWLCGLLENYGLSPSLVKTYFQAFRAAVEEHLGEDANLILGWFDKQNITIHS